MPSLINSPVHPWSDEERGSSASTSDGDALHRLHMEYDCSLFKALATLALQLPRNRLLLAFLVSAVISAV